ncbi:MAG: hypothetical protein J0G32_06030, partial [Alphaproteobacteria bacterium]|nr:hypothetical protein [Alphaproteobacteria bacterium]
MKLIKMVFAVIIFAVAACAEDKSKLKPFDYEKCKYSEGFSYEECMDLQLYKAFGKDWYKVKEFWFEFQNAVKNNDKEKLADMMDYPLDLFHLNKFVAPDDRERDVKLMVIKNKEE